MAFDLKDLSVLAYANGFTLWHYITPDGPAAVRAAGYMNAADGMMRPGDVVLANMGPAAGILLVAANANGTVDLSDAVPLGAANSD